MSDSSHYEDPIVGSSFGGGVPVAPAIRWTGEVIRAGGKGKADLEGKGNRQLAWAGGTGSRRGNKQKKDGKALAADKNDQQ